MLDTSVPTGACRQLGLMPSAERYSTQTLGTRLGCSSTQILVAQSGTCSRSLEWQSVIVDTDGRHRQMAPSHCRQCSWTTEKAIYFCLTPSVCSNSHVAQQFTVALGRQVRSAAYLGARLQLATANNQLAEGVRDSVGF